MMTNARATLMCRSARTGATPTSMLNRGQRKARAAAAGIVFIGCRPGRPQGAVAA